MTFAIRKDFVLRFLKAESHKFLPNETFIYDSYTTGIDNLHNLYVKNHPHMFFSKDASGKEAAFDGFKAFADKLLWNLEIFVTLKSFPCPVIVTFHEQVAKG